MIAETLSPALTPPPEQFEQAPEPPLETMRIGSAVMHEEVEVEGVDQAYLDQGIQALMAHANGMDIRPEDAGRVHDIEAAYEAALVENKIFEAHTEALHENEIFDAHVAAIKEDEERTAAAEATAAEKEAEQLTKTPTPMDAATQHTAELTTRIDYVGPENIRDKAASVLKELGYTQPLSPASEVRTDYETGNLMIVDGKDIKILEPQINGKTQVTEYHFDEKTNVLSIEAQGIGVVTARVGDYAPNNINGVQPSRAIVLPRAVANLVGAKTAVPIEV